MGKYGKGVLINRLIHQLIVLMTSPTHKFRKSQQQCQWVTMGQNTRTFTYSLTHDQIQPAFVIMHAHASLIID